MPWPIHNNVYRWVAVRTVGYQLVVELNLLSRLLPFPFLIILRSETTNSPTINHGLSMWETLRYAQSDRIVEWFQPST